MKVINFVKENKKTILVGVSSFLACTTFIAVIWGVGEAAKYYQNSRTKEACRSSYKMMCVQVHACGAGKVKDCDDTVEKMHRCDDVSKLPIKEIINACEEDLRHIECTDDVPGTCQTFMLE